MMRVTEAAFSLYPVRDLERARRFYGGLLGLTETVGRAAGAGGRVEYRIGSHRLVLTTAEPPFVPGVSGGVLALRVEDFETMIARLRALDVPILTGPVDTPLGRTLVISDPDGNALALVDRAPDLSGPAIVHQ